jgi:H+/gluconate symporter-like permease
MRVHDPYDVPADLAPVSQPVEEIALKATQSGFEPQRGHHASNDVIAFLGDANIALFIGLLIASCMVRFSMDGEDGDGVGKVLTSGFHTTGEILLVTGVGGSLGAVIAASGMDRTLEELFSVDESAPVFLSICWLGSSPPCCTSRSARSRSARSPPPGSSRPSSTPSASTRS